MSGNWQPAADIRNHLYERLDDMMVLLADLVGVESPSDVPASQGPILDILAAQFDRLGYGVWRIPGRANGGHLYARARTRRRFHPA